MTDNNKHIIDVDSEAYEEAPKALRDAYKELRKLLDATATERDGFRSQLASREISDVLSDKGFKNPKRVEKDLIADKIDATDKAAVEAWLSENGDDYAKGEAAPESTSVPNEQQQQFEALSAGGTLSAPADMSKWELAKSEITKDMSGEDVIAVYAKHGI